jgi:hypothetical protein
MPETRFEDLMVLELRGQETEAAIDTRFLEVCVPGSILVKSVVTSAPLCVGAIVNGGSVVIHTPSGHTRGGVYATVTLSGVRKGRAGRRFPTFSREQKERNDRFWTQAYD